MEKKDNYYSKSDSHTMCLTFTKKPSSFTWVSSKERKEKKKILGTNISRKTR